jgi:hypothetical protein
MLSCRRFAERDRFIDAVERARRDLGGIDHDRNVAISERLELLALVRADEHVERAIQHRERRLQLLRRRDGIRHRHDDHDVRAGLPRDIDGRRCASGHHRPARGRRS